MQGVKPIDMSRKESKLMKLKSAFKWERCGKWKIRDDMQMGWSCLPHLWTSDSCYPAMSIL